MHVGSCDLSSTAWRVFLWWWWWLWWWDTIRLGLVGVGSWRRRHEKRFWRSLIRSSCRNYRRYRSTSCLVWWLTLARIGADRIGAPCDHGSNKSDVHKGSMTKRYLRRVSAKSRQTEQWTIQSFPAHAQPIDLDSNLLERKKKNNHQPIYQEKEYGIPDIRSTNHQITWRETRNRALRWSITLLIVNKWIWPH